ncbi:MAG: hypothetical protein J7498_13190 [Sphingobium sp.]|nr:hypothetical protein [Sphingobium sp.]
MTIRDDSVGGRDDFSHGGYRISDGRWLFGFGLGRPMSRVLTTEEKAANPQYDSACVWQIEDGDLTPAQRQSVQDWLQAKEDGMVAVLGGRREHQMMLLWSVRSIESY